MMHIDYILLGKVCTAYSICTMYVYVDLAHTYLQTNFKVLHDVDGQVFFTVSTLPNPEGGSEDVLGRP